MQAPTTDNGSLVEVSDLKMYFPITKGLLKRKVADIKAVDGITFNVHRHETLGLVGESGCGKTTTGRCILRLYEPTAGRIVFDGTDISTMPESELKPIRHVMGAVFQDPYGSLNPRQAAGSIVADPLRVQGTKNANYIRERVADLFKLVGLDPDMMDRVPHEFSGGQRQRIGLARALALNPSLVICDEPVSALDVSIQAQIINLLEELQEKLGLTYMFIAHDLAVVEHISDRVAVMYLGRIVEIAESDQLFENPLHPYTQALLSAIPMPDPRAEKTRKRIVLKGEVPSPVNPPPGCHFHPRCDIAESQCNNQRPALRDNGDGHFVACTKVL